MELAEINEMYLFMHFVTAGGSLVLFNFVNLTFQPVKLVPILRLQPLIISSPFLKNMSTRTFI